MNLLKRFGLLVLVITLSTIVLVGCNSEESKKDATNNTSNPDESIKEITTEELSSHLDSEDWTIVDARINDAYNGWIIDGVDRGGHIKGAVDFSANWIDADAKDKDKILGEALKVKGIDQEKNIVIYDSNGEDAKKVAAYLSKKGFKNLFLYDVTAWAKDEALAMESYPNHELIVPASWVKETLDSNNDGKPLKIFEVSWGDEADDYKKGHIKGAVHINTDEVEEGPVWNRLSDKNLEQFALNNGITTETTVVLYGASTTPAYRVAAILKYMGVKDVRVLNGGYGAWTRAGYEEETTENNKQAVESFGATVPVNSDYIVDMPVAKKILADKEASTLVDIRSWEEHIGETSGYDYIKPKGRPTGAIWGYDLQAFNNIDNTMRNGYEIENMWKEMGITKDKNLSFFCGTGWRVAEVITFTDVLGFEHTSLYDGGWNEWSLDTNNPIETGEPEVKPAK